MKHFKDYLSLRTFSERLFFLACKNEPKAQIKTVETDRRNKRNINSTLMPPILKQSSALKE